MLVRQVCQCQRKPGEVWTGYAGDIAFDLKITDEAMLARAYLRLCAALGIELKGDA